MNFRHTTKCLICGKAAKYHHGFVLKDKESILAGWCDDHADGTVGEYDKLTCRMLSIKYREGCVGKWIKAFGIQEDTY